MPKKQFRPELGVKRHQPAKNDSLKHDWRTAGILWTLFVDIFVDVVAQDVGNFMGAVLDVDSISPALH